MRKAELVDAIAEKSGCTKKAAGDMLEAFTEAVTETVAAGGRGFADRFWYI